jgi:hypothetical protein
MNRDMTALTQIAITARKSIRYILLGILFLSIGRILWGLGATAYLQLFPPAPPAPTVKFGKLTKVPFPENGPAPKLSYTIETATGGLPTNINPQAKVFFMPKVNPNLLSLDSAKYKAVQMGFNNPNPVQESDTLYKFSNNRYPTTLTTNIVTNAFSISYDLIADRSPITNRPPAAEIAASTFRTILSSANNLPEDLTGPMIPEYYRLESGSLVRVLALSEADLTKVSLFRKAYDKLPSLTAKPNESNVWGIISGAPQKDQQIIAGEYHYFPVDETQFSTYPIITPEQAFAGLQNGSAYVASMGQYQDGNSLKIRRVYLAYFDPGIPSDFYQPIYVFDSGENDPDNSFVAYIPAVDPSYYSEE